MERVLVLLQSPKDARVACEQLGTRLCCLSCDDLGALCREIRRGAAVVVVSEECLATDSDPDLKTLLSTQESWSDLPVIVITHSSRDSTKASEVRDTLRNAVLLERPIRLATLQSVVWTAFKARLRQYQLREFIEERRIAEEELERIGAQLRHTDRVKDEFIAMVAHELRNPLGALTHALSVYRRGPDALAKQRASEVIERQSRQLLRLTEDLLDVSRITSGKITLHCEVLDVALVLDRALEVVASLIREKAHTLHTDYTPGRYFIEADPFRMEQIVTNLLTNAAKYTEPRGDIWVAVSRQGSEVEIRLRDNGVGISGEVLPHIFDLFAQVESSLGKSRGGLGIGLNIVRRLVELHRGTIEAFSEGPARGSEFLVRLPALFEPGQG